MTNCSGNPILKIEGVSKRFGKREAVKKISLELENNSIFCLLGPNGAGKSTFIKMMLGLIWPDEGSIFIKGNNLLLNRPKALAHVGAIIETPCFYKHLSGETNLRIIGQLSGKITNKMIKEVLEIVGLKGRETDKVTKYSYGMKQRLGIAMTLLPKPDLIVLDEPTNGLDPHGIRDIRNLIRSFPEKFGITVFFSSHLLHEVSQICDQVAIINNGKLLVQGRVDDLTNKNGHFIIHTDNVLLAEKIIKDKASVEIFYTNDASIHLKVLKDSIADVNTLLVTNGIKVSQIISSRETLEDVFMKLTHHDIKIEPEIL